MGSATTSKCWRSPRRRRPGTRTSSSTTDAHRLIAAVTDGGKYTDTEKDTMEYIRANYKFTEEADSWFRSEIAKFAAR